VIRSQHSHERKHYDKNCTPLSKQRWAQHGSSAALTARVEHRYLQHQRRAASFGACCHHPLPEPLHTRVPAAPFARFLRCYSRCSTWHNFQSPAGQPGASCPCRQECIPPGGCNPHSQSFASPLLLMMPMPMLAASPPARILFQVAQGQRAA
jgi:hypothetical protein